MRKTSLFAQFFCAAHLTPARVFGALAGLLLVLAAPLAPAQDSSAARADCDYSGPSGICVFFEENARQFNPALLEASYLRAKREFEARYHVDLSDVRGPVVRVVHIADFARAHPVQNRLDGDLGGDHGWTGFAAGEIALTGPAVMRHETFHYLLWKTGYSNRLNAMHEHPAFDEYRDGHWLPKRASVENQATAGQVSGESATGSAPTPAMDFLQTITQ